MADEPSAGQLELLNKGYQGIFDVLSDGDECDEVPMKPTTRVASDIKQNNEKNAEERKDIPFPWKPVIAILLCSILLKVFLFPA